MHISYQVCGYGTDVCDHYHRRDSLLTGTVSRRWYYKIQMKAMLKLLGQFY